jgi:hypothetical protein
MKIDGYPTITTLSDNDLLLIETASDSAYKGIKASDLKAYIGLSSGGSGGGGSGGTDSLASDVVLLMPFTTATGTTDSKGNTTTALNGASISTTQSKWGTGALYLNGSQQISVAHNPAFSMGSSPLTVECWIYPMSNNITIADKSGQAYVSYPNWAFSLNSSNQLQTAIGILNTANIQTGIDSSFPIALNTWYHVCFVWSGNSFTFYINGIQSGIVNANFTPTDRNAPLVIGIEQGQNSGWFEGYINDFRITAAQRYTANFTPPTSLA